jgi:DNA-binding Xre family transcriptional regulator
MSGIYLENERGEKMAKKGMSPEKAEQIRLSRGIDKGTKLRIARVQKGLSQSELSEASGVPVKTLQRYEQEPHQIDKAKLSTLCAICTGLNVKISDIIEDKELLKQYNSVK